MKLKSTPANVQRITDTFLAVLLGALAFAAITGGRILRPQHTGWLMTGDPATNLMGWQFFRHSPMLQLPLGANRDYGMDIGSSIVFTDSIPLFALLFKPFDAILPASFQYFGLWILVCFVLQAFFAHRLLAKFTEDRWLPLLGSVFFVLAPAFLWRLHGHYALFGQWVILAGLNLYFSRRFSATRWVVLLATASLIHAYLLVMTGAVWAADIVQRRLRRECTTLDAGRNALAGVLVTAVVMWLAGYFMVRGDGLTLVPGIFRMNLLSLIDPDDIWSKTLRDREQTGGDYEGFNYLGLGVLVLVLIAFAEIMRNPRLRTDWRVVAPLALACIGLAIFALSPQVAFGRRELVAYHLPSFLDGVLGAFRASGRMFWPVYYTIYLAVLCFIFRRFSPRVAASLCVVLIAMQMADSSQAFQHFRTRYREAGAWASPMQSPLWNDIARHYRHIVYVLPRNVPDAYLPLANFASTHGMTINIGYFARVNPKKAMHAQQYVAHQVMTNTLHPDSLYVFEDNALWQVALRQAGSADFYGTVDGFRILAPRLRECDGCDRRAMEGMAAGAGASRP